MRGAFTFALVAACLACQADPSPPPSDAGARDAAADQGVAIDVSTPDGAAPDAPADAAPDAPGDAAAQRLRVLFVGNSYTYVNDLPALLARMAVASPGPTIETVSVTVGGATLRSHWDTNDAPARIMAGGWDAVVIQGQSVEPALNPGEFRTYAQRFGTLAVEHRARAVFYATWPRREGDKVYAESWSGGTPTAFNARLDDAYAQAAAAVGGDVAHVGNAWMRALGAYPAINLYADDGSHPSPAGTWIAGCVMYRALTGSAPTPATDAAATGVAPADARSLRELVASQGP